MTERRITQGSGFTLVETAFAVVILTILLGSLTLILNTTRGTYDASTSAMNLESQGSRAMRRIVDTVRAVDLASVQAVPAEPLSGVEFLFQSAGPYVDDQTQWSDPQRIHLDLAAGSIVWSENPGLPDEQTAVWCGGVADYLEGETLNFLDDNGNGLIDERGLAFVRSGDGINVYLTLEAAGPNGEIEQQTWTARITCRN